MPIPRRGDPRITTVILPYQVTIPTATDFVLLTTDNPIIPTMLLDYYNRRCTVQLAAEVYNGEVILVALDTAPDPNPILLDDVNYPPDVVPPQPRIQHRVICSVTNPDPRIRRLLSPTADVSALFRTGQHQVFGLLGRRVEETVVTLIRNATVIVYLGELAGPRPDQRVHDQGRFPQLPPDT